MMPAVRLLCYGLLAAGLVFVLSQRWGAVPPLGTLLDPHAGLYRTARQATHPAETQVQLPGLEQPVTVLRDERGVPHIFAASDHDAVMTLGYVVAQDRLFQMDFIPRVAAGRLASALGPAAVASDRFLRATGMDWAARRNLAQLLAEGGIEHDLLTWYAEGVNAWIDQLAEEDLPFEFRLLGYRPDRYSPLQSVRLLQYMGYDLTYGTDQPVYTQLRTQLGEEAYALLYPALAAHYVPIIPPGEGSWQRVRRSPFENLRFTPPSEGAPVASDLPFNEPAPGKGSNNWAVDGTRSATGAPILAGDMHLALSLPAIWYEVHLVTPTMNTYGVTIPGSPLPVEAFNDFLGWAFTNSGTDQIDHYRLVLDETGRRYQTETGWRDLEMVRDTIPVNRGTAVVDTLWYSHFGPVQFDDTGATAVRWVAHEPTHTLAALWGMNHARNLPEFEAALTRWDTPMQNILYADRLGNIAIRSTGYLPLRKCGSGAGLLDGTSDACAWTGRVPFEQLPYARNPRQGYLTSTNQQPADSTYPFYQGHDWRESYRSLRINDLLRAKPQHRVEDLMQYQSDVKVVQRDLFAPLLDTLSGLNARADTLRQLLCAWDGRASVDRPEPLVLKTFLSVLKRLAWDEPVFEALPPHEGRLYHLLRTRKTAPWLDVQATEAREDAAGLLRLALDSTAAALARTYGWGTPHWRWGDQPGVIFRHLTRSEALRALWRGPFPWPGFDATLSPGGDRPTTHSASWRVVVDFSQSPPQGYGIYPGGQSGNPFSPFYDLQLADYMAFRHYPLHKPAHPEDLPTTTARITLRATAE